MGCVPSAQSDPEVERQRKEVDKRLKEVCSPPAQISPSYISIPGQGQVRANGQNTPPWLWGQRQIDRP